MAGCDGSCCAAFTISKPLPEIPYCGDPDRFDLLAMLIPIGYEEACDRWDQFADGYRPPEPAEHYYRCNRWDETTRLCGDYEHRPAMCRDFPYGRACEYGCDCAHTRPVALLTAGAAS